MSQLTALDMIAVICKVDLYLMIQTAFQSHLFLLLQRFKYLVFHYSFVLNVSSLFL